MTTCGADSSPQRGESYTVRAAAENSPKSHILSTDFTFRQPGGIVTVGFHEIMLTLGAVESVASVKVV